MYSSNTADYQAEHVWPGEERSARGDEERGLR